MKKGETEKMGKTNNRSKSESGKTRMISVALAVCVILSIIVPAGTTNYMPQDAYSFAIELPDLQVDLSYHDTHIYETVEFKISVTDEITALPVANANVSFILPIIILETDEAGIVFFYAPFISKVSAPHIRIEYIESPRDTSYTFPLSVTKEGYKTHNTNISVHIRPHSN